MSLLLTLADVNGGGGTPGDEALISHWSADDLTVGTISDETWVNRVSSKPSLKKNSATAKTRVVVNDGTFNSHNYCDRWSDAQNYAEVGDGVMADYVADGLSVVFVAAGLYHSSNEAIFACDEVGLGVNKINYRIASSSITTKKLITSTFETGVWEGPLNASVDPILKAGYSSPFVSVLTLDGDSGVGKLYLNKVDKSSFVGASWIKRKLGIPYILGHQTIESATYGFNKHIAEMRIYNKALSVSESEALADALAVTYGITF